MTFCEIPADFKLHIGNLFTSNTNFCATEYAAEAPAPYYSVKRSFSNTQANILLVTQEALKNCWKTKKYLDLYITYLQGAISIEEFTQLAEEHVVEKIELKREEILRNADYLKKLIKELDENDLADLLNIDFPSLVLALGEEE